MYFKKNMVYFEKLVGTTNCSKLRALRSKCRENDVKLSKMSLTFPGEYPPGVSAVSLNVVSVTQLASQDGIGQTNVLLNVQLLGAAI